MAKIAALMRAYGGIAERTPDGVALHFKRGERLRAALDALAEKERSCCAALQFTVTEEAGSSISLRIGGKASDSTAVVDLAERLGINPVVGQIERQ